MTTAPIAMADQHRSTLLVVVVLLALSLVPVWCFGYLPMQDYPQHLFQGKLTAGVLSGHGVESPFFLVHLKPTYSLLYVLIWLFQLAMSLENAGRAAVSIYLVLVAWAAWRTMRFCARREIAGWGAVFLFPLAFSQMYFMGFINFLYAIPLMWMIVLGLLEQRGWTGRRVAVQAGLLVVLLFVHPIGVGIAGVIVGAWAIAGWRERAARRWFLPALGIAVAVAVCWFLGGLMFGGGVAGGRMAFESPMKNAAFVLYAFAGLRGVMRPDWIALALWVAGAGVVGWSAVRNRARVPGDVAWYGVAAALALFVVVVFGPFTFNGVDYLNLRVTLALYMVLGFLAALVPMGRGAGVACAVIAAGLLGRSWMVQRAVSAETAEIAPVVAAIPAGEMVLPLVFDAGSAEADAYYFSLHLDDCFYYPVRKEGAVPYLWYAPGEGNTPVSFRPGMQPAAPGEYSPAQFRWEKYGAAYRYFLVRGGSESLYRYMELHAALRVESGKWRLYERAAATTQQR